MTTVSMERLASHARAIAKENGVVLIESELVDSTDAMTNFVRKTIVMPCIDNLKAYGTAMHELGHLLAPGGIHEDRKAKRGAFSYRNYHEALKAGVLEFMIDEENAAWKWAKAHSLIWNEEMQQDADRALETYTSKRGVYDKQ